MGRIELAQGRWQLLTLLLTLGVVTICDWIHHSGLTGARLNRCLHALRPYILCILLRYALYSVGKILLYTYEGSQLKLLHNCVTSVKIDMAILIYWHPVWVLRRGRLREPMVLQCSGRV
jgi:hypothetical protein